MAQIDPTLPTVGGSINIWQDPTGRALRNGRGSGDRNGAVGGTMDTTEGLS